MTMKFNVDDEVRITGNYIGFFGNYKGVIGTVVGHETADSGAYFYFVDLGPTDNVVKLHETELERA